LPGKGLRDWGLRVIGVGCGVWGLGFRVQGLGCGVWGLKLGDEDPLGAPAQEKPGSARKSASLMCRSGFRV